jgi:tetratricopeptide (TPR) repeat protein
MSAPHSREVRAANHDPAVLEREVPLSQSLIWKRQREFYARRGLRAWSEDQVPAYITNNPLTAEIYAGIVFAFLRDCMGHGGRRPLSPENPLRVLELGAGTGKFAYLFLRHLTSLLRSENVATETVRYSMTDCAQNVLEAWQGNSYLAEFAQKGMLEFELLAAGEERGSRLFNEAKRSTGESGPLTLIANYVFDSLPQDAFVIQDGKIFEALVTTTASRQSSGEVADRTADLKLSYANVAVPPGRYPDASWNATLEHYRANLSAATVLFPSQALTTLKELARLSDGRTLVLAADKGETNQEQLALSQGPPAIEFHSRDCFSQMVNFDAMAKCFAADAGQALLPDKHFSSLSICAFLEGRRGEAFPAATAAYRQAQAAFGPDDLFTLLAWLNAHMEEMTVAQMLAALRLTRWDTTALMRFFPMLARQAREVVRERSDLRDAVLRAWDNYFPVTPGDSSLPFQCGVILLELKYFDDAAQMFRASQKILGPSAATSYNLGLCEQGLGRRDEALAIMVEACNLDPNFEPAKTARMKLESGSSPT